MGGFLPEEATGIIGLVAVALSVHVIKAFRFFMRSSEKQKRRKLPAAFAITCIAVVSVVVLVDLMLISQQPYAHLFHFGDFVAVFGALQTLFTFYLGSVSDALFGPKNMVEPPEKVAISEQ